MGFVVAAGDDTDIEVIRRGSPDVDIELPTMIATSTVSGHRADLVVHLTGLAVTAADVPSAVTPMLETFVRETAADGSAYFQLGDGSFMARAATGWGPCSARS